MRNFSSPFIVSLRTALRPAPSRLLGDYDMDCGFGFRALSGHAAVVSVFYGVRQDFAAGYSTIGVVVVIVAQRVRKVDIIEAAL